MQYFNRLYNRYNEKTGLKGYVHVFSVDDNINYTKNI